MCIVQNRLLFRLGNNHYDNVTSNVNFRYVRKKLYLHYRYIVTFQNLKKRYRYKCNASYLTPLHVTPLLPITHWS